MIKFSNLFKDKRHPDSWETHEIVEGKLYRYVDTGIGLPLIEILESQLPRLEGYDFYEPYWVVAQDPTYFAIYDREDQLIYSPLGFAKTYSLPDLVRAEGYASVSDFRAKHMNPEHGQLTDLDIWVRLALPAKVYLPSLKRK